MNWTDHIRIGKDCVQRRIYSNDEANPISGHEIHKAGISDLKGLYDISRSNYFCHVVFFTLDGAGSVETPEGRHVLGKGDLMLVPSGCPARYRIKGGKWRTAWFDIMKTARWSFLEGEAITVRPSGGELERLISTIEQLYQEMHGGEFKATEMSCLLADQLVIHLERELRHGEIRIEDKEGRMLRSLFRKVENRLQFRWTVGELAKEAHVSTSHLHLLCRCHLKRSPLKHVAKLRMRRAAELLLQTKAPVSDISYSVGYENPLNFSTAFRKLMKTSPREFRRENAKG